MNTITIELCAEDRARLDRLTAALEKRVEQETGLTLTSIDPMNQALAKAMDKASKPAETHQDEPVEAKESTKAETPTKEEAPTEGKETASQPDVEAEQMTLPFEPDGTKVIITPEQMQQRIVMLSAAQKGALKAKVRAIVLSYAPKVSELPADKFDEIWAKLDALEG